MYFCYLLKSINEKCLGDTYIGFTDDPLRRLDQHNGKIKGGAKKTNKKRPWNLVIVISNFPNKHLALQFEWAWQNPFLSKFTSEKVIMINIVKRCFSS
jgi:structure-specific endonuclease subunit SLX1